MKTFENATGKELRVYELLKSVMDPELGINIVDLGLIYEIHCGDDGINIVMTMTTPGCPVSGSIIDAVRTTLQDEFTEDYVETELVWKPAWSPERITPEGMKLLGWE